MISEITRHEILNAITGIIGCADMAYQLPAGTKVPALPYGKGGLLGGKLLELPGHEGVITR